VIVSNADEKLPGVSMFFFPIVQAKSATQEKHREIVRNVLCTSLRTKRAQQTTQG
jgi:hypothetical protein